MQMVLEFGWNADHPAGAEELEGCLIVHTLFNFLKPLCYCSHFLSREQESGKVDITGLDFHGRLPSASRCFRDLHSGRRRRCHRLLDLPASRAFSLPICTPVTSHSVPMNSPKGLLRFSGNFHTPVPGTLSSEVKWLEGTSAQLGSCSSTSGPHTAPIPVSDNPTLTNTLAKTAQLAESLYPVCLGSTQH